MYLLELLEAVVSEVLCDLLPLYLHLNSQVQIHKEVLAALLNLLIQGLDRYCPEGWHTLQGVQISYNYSVLFEEGEGLCLFINYDKELLVAEEALEV